MRTGISITRCLPTETWFADGGSLQNNSPQIKNAVVTTYGQSHILSYGDAKLKKQGYTVSEHFFNMFSWKFIKGNAATAIPDAYSIVLTQSAAKALFGNADPINKIVKIDNEYDAKVTAIVADPPGNSTFQFDFINTFNYAGDLKRGYDQLAKFFLECFLYKCIRERICN